MLRTLPISAIESIDETYCDNSFYRILKNTTLEVCNKIENYTLTPAQIFVEVVLQLDKIKKTQEDYPIAQLYNSIEQEYKIQFPDKDSLQRCQIVSTILMPLAVLLQMSKWNLYHNYGERIMSQITMKEVTDWNSILQLCDKLENETHRLSLWINSYMEEGNDLFLSDIMKKLYQVPINNNEHSFKYLKSDTNPSIKQSFEHNLYSASKDKDNKAILDTFKEYKYYLNISAMSASKLYQELKDYYNYLGSYDAINDLLKKIRP